MNYTDTITYKEAQHLGIVDVNCLGFVKPQTAFKNITEQLLAELKKGNLVWRQGWRSGVVVKGKTYGAQNYETQRPYTGGNAFFIHLQNLLNGTDYNFFLTAKQIVARGGIIKKGTKPFPVSVFIKSETEKIVKRGGEKITVLQEEKGVIWYHVYPIELVDNLKLIIRKERKSDTFNEVIVTDAETIIQNMPKAPQIKHGGDSAFYVPILDYVQMPFKKAFKVQQEYYSVLFHELIHSTGHSKRLNRGNDTRRRDGSIADKKAYAFEELIAEIGSAFLCGVCEIDYYTVNNSAAYIKGWAKRVSTEIQEDANFLKRVVFKAVRAVNFMIGKTLEKHGKVHQVSNEKIDLSGVNDTVLIFMNTFLATHNKVVSKEDLMYILTTFQTAIKNGLIQAKHPLRAIANATQTKLANNIRKLNPNEKVKIEISNKKMIEAKIHSLHGLGFWNIIASTIIGKTAEHFTHKHLTKNSNTPTLNGIGGFVRADNRETVKVPGTYKLNGELGKFLGEIQPYKYSIVLTGDTHAGKTEVVMQLANAFADIGKTVGTFMLEQGGLESRDTQEAIDRNIPNNNLQNVFITGEASKGIETVKEYATKFDVIIIDSWQKLKIPSTKFDDLRHEFPNTVFIVIFQQNGEGGTRGGVSADFDTPVALKVHKVDSTFVNNYVEMKKNRGNSQTLGLKYMVKAKKTLNN